MPKFELHRVIVPAEFGKQLVTGDLEDVDIKWQEQTLKRNELDDKVFMGTTERHKLPKKTALSFGMHVSI